MQRAIEHFLPGWRWIKDRYGLIFTRSGDRSLEFHAVAVSTTDDDSVVVTFGADQDMPVMRVVMEALRAKRDAITEIAA